MDSHLYDMYPFLQKFIILLLLQAVNSTYALWTWHRNQDNYKENAVGDQIYIVRQPELCMKDFKVILP